MEVCITVIFAQNIDKKNLVNLKNRGMHLMLDSTSITKISLLKSPVLNIGRGGMC